LRGAGGSYFAPHCVRPEETGSRVIPARLH
jgi:hypothetical protein